MAFKVSSAVILYVLSQALLVTAARQAVCPLSTVTSCFDSGPSLTPRPGQDGCLTIYLPECVGCGCPTCSHTHVYTKTLEVFGGLFGVRPSAYTIKEIYRGMSRAPIYPQHTGVPLGFTVAQEVCTTCGFLPLTKTMTYPIGGRPEPLTLPLPSVPRPTKRVEPEGAPDAPVITGAPIRLVAEKAEEQEQDQEGEAPAQDQAQDQEQTQDQGQARAQAGTKAQATKSPVIAAAARPERGWIAMKLFLPLGVLFW